MNKEQIMTDKELLHFAAKAAGIETLYWTKDGHELFRREGGIQTPWNPLADDGDAFRLAVKIRARIFINASIWVTIEHSTICEGYTVDPCAATRRAIVRAAAEIGKTP